MTPTYTILIILVLLFFGINFTANNNFITFILKNFFYGSNRTMALVRFLGFLLLGSIVLILMQLHYYALILDIIVVILFTFFTIQGRSKARRIAAKKRQDRMRIHQSTVNQRKRDLAKKRANRVKELESRRNKPQSLKQIKNKQWNDGSKTNRDLIRDLNKD